MTKARNDHDENGLKTHPFQIPATLRNELDEKMSAQTEPSYQAWKAADRRITKLSKGALILMGSVYRGDDQRHELVHQGCANSFWVSVNEILAEGLDICPYCNLATDLGTFCPIEVLQDFVLTESLENAFFYRTNDLGLPIDVFDFYCLVCKRPYRTTYRNWWENRGRSNGCPDCSK